MSQKFRWGRVCVYILCLAFCLYAAICLRLAPTAIRTYRGVYTNTLQIQQMMPLGPFGNPRTSFFEVKEHVSAWQVVIWCCIAPFTNTSPGRFDLANGQTINYPSPRSVYNHEIPLNRFTVAAKLHSEVFAFPVSLTVLMFAGFALLPATRRIHRVHWSHLIRITLYSSTFLIIPIGHFLIFHNFSVPGRIGPRPDSVFSLLCFIALPVMLTFWWGKALSSYLKLRHAWWVTITLMVLGTILIMGLGKLRIIQWHWLDWWLLW